MRASRLTACLVFLALVAWTLWLRWPSLEHRVWNVDEAIHSAVADRLLDGGVLYRDAIDQRTPLSYYAVAGLYGLCGRNNLFALHVFTALLVAGTAFLLWRLGRAARQPAAGGWAAALYATLATTLLYRGDANAFNTEWLVALFTTGAALLFLHGLHAHLNRWLIASGALLGLAFLSKQPALLDAGAPALALAYLAWRRRDTRPALPGRIAALAAGWAVPVLLTALYFAAHGALRDAVDYAWNYNVRIYGPEIGTAARLASGVKLWDMFVDSSPALLAWAVAALGLTAFRLVQRTNPPPEEAENPTLALLGAWFLTSLGGAVSGGRGFDHYFIQALPPLCLLTGWLLARASAAALAPHRRTLPRALAALALLATLLPLARTAAQKRSRTLPPDASVRAAEFIRRTAPAQETIFVWGYHPEFYLFSERSPASRYVYASFMTGMVPWTNVAPERDTAYAIVPGALDSLLAELESRRPMFFVDCSAGPNRFWQKYPLTKFPRLKAFVDAHYVLADPDQFRGQGFALYLLRDEARRAPLGIPARDRAELGEPAWFGPSTFTSQPTTITLAASSPNGQLSGLQLLIDGQVFTGASFSPAGSMKVAVTVQFDAHRGARHTLQVRARGADGSTRDGAPQEIAVTEGLLSEAETAAFALPQLTAPLRPLFVQTLYGASADVTDGRSVFFAHAPSTVAFVLPPEARAIQGGFGFREAAYAPGNKAPTDGAEFRVELVSPDGQRRTLFSRLLQPLTQPGDRGPQSFRAPIPAGLPPETRLDFVISPGPNGNAASDWTFWTDLRLETSR